MRKSKHCTISRRTCIKTSLILVLLRSSLICVRSPIGHNCRPDCLVQSMNERLRSYTNTNFDTHKLRKKLVGAVSQLHQAIFRRCIIYPFAPSFSASTSDDVTEKAENPHAPLPRARGRASRDTPSQASNGERCDLGVK